MEQKLAAIGELNSFWLTVQNSNLYKLLITNIVKLEEVLYINVYRRNIGDTLVYQRCWSTVTSKLLIDNTTRGVL